MTAAVTAPPPASDRHDGVTQWSVLRSEWIKFRSLRSTWISLAAMVAVVIGLGALFSAVRAHRYNQLPHGFDHFDPTQISLRGVFLAQLAIGVLGILFVTGEYATGMIHSSVAAVPRRWPVLTAKAAVLAAAAFGTGFVACFGAFLVGQQALTSTHRQATLSTPHAFRAILGASLYLTLIVLLAVGLGTLIRNTGGAIATLVGIVLVLPLLDQALPDPYATDIGKYLPLNAGTQIIATVNRDAGQLGPWAGLLVTACWALAASAAATVMLLRRDA